MYLRTGRIGIFDLTSNRAGEQELQEGATWQSVSSIGFADRLVAEHGKDSIVLGTGILTGSLVPAACAGLVQTESGTNGTSRRMPLLGFAGTELKLSGFDFIVVTGVAKEPGYIWIRDGIIEFVAAPGMGSMDSWARTDRIRSDQGDNKIQVLSIGPAGDAGLVCSQLITNHWGGEDKAGLAAEFGRKKLVGIAFRGMGELEISEPAGHFEHSIGIRKDQLAKLGPNHGLASYSEAARRDDFHNLVHRHVACFGCPFPCRSFVKLQEDPKEMRLVGKEPGYLVYDISTLEKAFQLGLGAADAVHILARCARVGAEPMAVLLHLEREGAEISSKSAESVLLDVSAGKSIAESKGIRNFEASFDDPQKYETCLSLGLCPRYWAKAGFDMSLIASFAEAALGRTLPTE